MLHLENFFEKSFALLLTTPISKKKQKKLLHISYKYAIVKPDWMVHIFFESILLLLLNVQTLVC
jgi:hypothetical protein